MALNEIKKMKQGMSYSCKEKTIILNVFKYFRFSYPDVCVTELVRRTAKATGCSEKSIFQFRKEESSATGFKEPSKTKIRKNPNINSRDMKYDFTVRQAIRNIIYDLKYRNIIPSLNTILKQVNIDSQIPNFSLMTLRRLLFDMGFFYEKSGNKSILVDRSNNNDNSTPPKRGTGKKVAGKSSAGNNPVSNNQSSSSNRGGNTRVGNIQASSNNHVGSNNQIGSNNHVAAPVTNKYNNNLGAPMSNVQHRNENLEHMPHMVLQNMPPNHQSIVPSHVQLMNEQNHRVLQMHMPPPEPQLMSSLHPTHNMMMLNPHRDLIPHPHPQSHTIPSNMDMHLKYDVPPWMHSHHHNMVKSE